MGLTLLSATPSPYARKVRIALQEKNIPFELKNEVPWDQTTETPKHNPLEQLPVLIHDDGTAIYESTHILEYLFLKYKTGSGSVDSLEPEDVDDRLKAKQIDVLATGMMDAVVLIFFETSRDEDKQSKNWKARQERKVHGGLDALEAYAKAAGPEGFLIGGKLTIADLAVGSVLGFYDLNKMPWRESHRELEKYFNSIDERESFKTTRPYMFEIKDKIV